MCNGVSLIPFISVGVYEKEKFFDRTQSNQIGNIDFLAGVYDFRKQITNGQTIKQIQDSWEPKLSKYKIMRRKYLLYE